MRHNLIRQIRSIRVQELILVRRIATTDYADGLSVLSLSPRKGFIVTEERFFLFIALCRMQNPTGWMLYPSENTRACSRDFQTDTASMARKRHCIRRKGFFRFLSLPTDTGATRDGHSTAQGGPVFVSRRNGRNGGKRPSRLHRGRKICTRVFFFLLLRAKSKLYTALCQRT